jgi:hypothetical protein
MIRHWFPRSPTKPDRRAAQQLRDELAAVVHRNDPGHRCALRYPSPRSLAFCQTCSAAWRAEEPHEVPPGAFGGWLRVRWWHLGTRRRLRALGYRPRLLGPAAAVGIVPSPPHGWGSR